MRLTRTRVGYVIALPLVGVSMGLVALFARDGQGPVALLLLPSVLVAAYYGGLRAGLASTLAVTTFTALIATPAGRLAVHQPHDLARVIALFAVGCANSVLMEALHRARQRAEAGYARARVSETMFHSSPVAKSLSRLDDRRIVQVNAAYLRTFGVTREQVIGRTPADAGIVVEAGWREAIFRALREDGEIIDHEVSLQVPSGEARTVLLSSRRIEFEGEQLVLTTFLDVTARTQAQDAARASDERMHELAGLVDAWFWVMDVVEFRLQYISTGYERLTGRTCEQHMRNPADWLEAVHPEDRARLTVRFADPDAMQGEEDPFRIVRTDGSIRWIVARVYPIRDASGRVVRVAGVCDDITARQEAELREKASEDRFRQLAEAIDEVFWMVEVASNQLVYVSPAYERIWGRSLAELRTTPDAWSSAIHVDDRDRVLQASAKEHEGSYNERYRIVRPDGTIRWIEDRAFVVRDARGQVIRVAGLAQDITEDLRIEENLLQAQKLESIGMLAGGVAHDFNNILCVITANTEMLEESLPAGTPDHGLVQDIASAAARASSLTRQLLAFGRKQVVRATLVDLNQTVQEARQMLRRMLREDMQLRVSLDPDIGRVLVDAGQLVQVLMNLCVNARDAGATSIDISTRGESGHVVLAVADSGHGMTDEVKARVFEPFFTTKGVGQGTGLGLAVVHGIVHASGGTIELDSTPGKGTTFRIRIPVSAPLVETAVAPPRMRVTGDERVLLVDDDPRLRAAAARSLQQHGYRVVQACDGQEALQILRQPDCTIDVMVTDIVMPVMGGRELVELALRELPALRVLYTSGYTDDEIMRRGISHDTVAFLEKPYGGQALAAKVRHVLDANV